MKKIVFITLSFYTKRILKKYKPKVIAITGSVGKTSTTQTVGDVLGSNFSVRKSYKNYNNELGVPLTVIGELSPRKSIVGWAVLFLKATKLLLVKNDKYPECLVLEIGIDRPGDMEYLASMVHPDLSVITFVGGSHLEYFKSQSELTKEKLSIINYTKTLKPIIINADSPEIMNGMAEYTNVHRLSYGFSKQADLRILLESFRYKKLDFGFETNFSVLYKSNQINFKIDKFISIANVYSLVAAIAVGAEFGISLEEIKKVLEKSVPPKGRMNLIQGINNTTIFDDTYNSSPASSVSAIDTLNMVPRAKTASIWAVFGDMLELGGLTEHKHRALGKYAKDSGVTNIVTVGELAQQIVIGAEDSGMNKDNTHNFKNKKSSIKFLKDNLKEGDIVLVKGSQGSRMEDVVKELMLNKNDAEDLLVRQEPFWLK